VANEDMGMIRLAMTKRWMALAGGLAAVGLAAGPAAAQLAQRSNAPIDITADELEVVNAQCLATYKGAAEALQDTVRLRADILKIYYKPTPGAAKPGGTGANCGNELDHMEAIGQVYYVTPERRIHGDNAVYDKAADTMVITGDVIAIDGQNVARGARMVIKVSTNDGRMESGGAGTKSKPGRVRTVIYPKQDQTPAKSQPPAAPPPAPH
jgi:lipopolysaccharide export system protein LptA